MRSLGFDPGAHLGWCLLDMAGRPRFLAGDRAEVGHQEERFRHGKVQMVRRISDEDLARALRDVQQIISDAAPDVVGIERILDVHPTARHEARTGQSIGTAIGTGLVNAQGIALMIYTVARLRGIRVITVEEARWRHDICGADRPPRGMSADTWISRIIPARIDRWPRSSNPHVRDAAGVAEWVGTQAKLRP